MIRIRFTTDTPAFVGTGHFADNTRGAEVARILRRLADQYEAGHQRIPLKIQDRNGIEIGTCQDPDAN